MRPIARWTNYICENISAMSSGKIFQFHQFYLQAEESNSQNQCK